MRDLIMHCRCNVTVGVKRQRDRGVAEELLDYLRMDTPREQKTGCSVAQVVNAHPG